MIDRLDFHRRVALERQRQIEKWGPKGHIEVVWMSILMEEIGEVAKAINELRFHEVDEELIQVAAVVEAWATTPQPDE